MGTETDLRKGRKNDGFPTSCEVPSRQIRPTYFMGRNYFGPSVREVLVACSGRDRKNEHQKYCSVVVVVVVVVALLFAPTSNPAIARSSDCCRHFVGSVLITFEQRCNTVIGRTVRASPLSMLGTFFCCCLYWYSSQPSMFVMTSATANLG